MIMVSSCRPLKESGSSNELWE